MLSFLTSAPVLWKCHLFTWKLDKQEGQRASCGGFKSTLLSQAVLSFKEKTPATLRSVSIWIKKERNSVIVNPLQLFYVCISYRNAGNSLLKTFFLESSQFHCFLKNFNRVPAAVTGQLLHFFISFNLEAKGNFQDRDLLYQEQQAPF